MRGALLPVSAAMLAVGACTAGTLPPGAFTVLRDLVSAGTVSSPGPGYVNMTRLQTDGIPTIQLDVERSVSNQYDMTLRAYSEAEVDNTDVLLATVDIRLLPSPGGPSGWALLPASFQQASAPFRGNLDAGLNVTTEWQAFSLPFLAKQGGPSGSLRWHFVLGALGPSRWQLRSGAIRGWHASANVTATGLPVCCNFGYEGRSPDAAWRNASLASAREIRMGSVSAVVVDGSSGKAAAGASVTVHQLAHTFRHGSAVDASVLSEASRGAPLGPDDARYIAVLRSGLFQTAVFEGGMKWPSWQNPALQNRTLEAYGWLKGLGYYVRMHNLVWPSCSTGHLPASLCALLANKSSPAAVEAAVEAHIRDEAGRPQFQGGPVAGIDDVDVCNEPVSNHELQDYAGTNATIARWLNTTAAALPRATWRVNDAHSCSGQPGLADHFEYDLALYRQIKEEFGGALTGVGCESHVRWNGASIPRYIRRMDALAALGLTVRITEHDMMVPDVELAGDQLRDLLIACFGHRACDGMLTWGFWTGRSWIGMGPFFELDWTPKPALAHYKSLLFSEWWTDGASGRTGARGEPAVVKVWQGVHNVTATLPDGRTGWATARLEQFDTGSVKVRVVV